MQPLRERFIAAIESVGFKYQRETKKGKFFRRNMGSQPQYVRLGHNALDPLYVRTQLRLIFEFKDGVRVRAFSEEQIAAIISG